MAICAEPLNQNHPKFLSVPFEHDQIWIRSFFARRASRSRIASHPVSGWDQISSPHVAGVSSVCALSQSTLRLVPEPSSEVSAGGSKGSESSAQFSAWVQSLRSLHRPFKPTKGDRPLAQASPIPGPPNGGPAKKLLFLLVPSSKPIAPKKGSQVSCIGNPS